jgi:hypothetical protein
MASQPTILLNCSFCGKNSNEVRKLIAGPKVYICDECIDLCNDIIKEETSVADDRSLPAQVPGGHLMPARIVTRFVEADLTSRTLESPLGILWECEGCGWKLRLHPDATPPAEHSDQIDLGAWPGPPRELSIREIELVPQCNAVWRAASFDYPRSSKPRCII